MRKHAGNTTKLEHAVEAPPPSPSRIAKPLESDTETPTRSLQEFETLLEVRPGFTGQTHWNYCTIFNFRNKEFTLVRTFWIRSCHHRTSFAKFPTSPPPLPTPSDPLRRNANPCHAKPPRQPSCRASTPWPQQNIKRVVKKTKSTRRNQRQLRKGSNNVGLLLLFRPARHLVLGSDLPVQASPRQGTGAWAGMARKGVGVGVGAGAGGCAHGKHAQGISGGSKHNHTTSARFIAMYRYRVSPP